MTSIENKYSVNSIAIDAFSIIYNPNEWLKSPELILTEYCRQNKIELFKFYNINIITGEPGISLWFNNVIYYIDCVSKYFQTVKTTEHNMAIFILAKIYGNCDTAFELKNLVNSKKYNGKYHNTNKYNSYLFPKITSNFETVNETVNETTNLEFDKTNLINLPSKHIDKLEWKSDFLKVAKKSLPQKENNNSNFIFPKGKKFNNYNRKSFSDRRDYSQPKIIDDSLTENTDFLIEELTITNLNSKHINNHSLNEKEFCINLKANKRKMTYYPSKYYEIKDNMKKLSADCYEILAEDYDDSGRANWVFESAFSVENVNNIIEFYIHPCQVIFSTKNYFEIIELSKNQNLKNYINKPNYYILILQKSD